MIIYTCITNNYCKLPEVMPDGCEYYCIGDIKSSPGWTCIISPDFGDPIRTSRYPKIMSHMFFDEAIYVDASKLHLINDKFIELCKNCLLKDKLFIMQHPHTHSYLEECAEYLYRGWVSEEELVSYTEKVKSAGFDFAKFFSPLCTIMWRKKEHKYFNEMWWKWYNEGGVRDQLSFSTSLQLSGIKYEYVYSRDFLNQFTDASPNGIWWSSRSGDYKYSDSKHPKDFVKRLSDLTGLSMIRFRMATHRPENCWFGKGAPLG
jgi:hypothetical protein